MPIKPERGISSEGVGKTVSRVTVLLGFRCPKGWRDGRLAQPVLALFLLLAISVGEAGERGLPAQGGILNFGKIDEHLYRGAQPDAAGIKSLKKLGVKLIVNLRMSGDEWKQEASEALANGILYTNFPMSGVGRPNDEQIRQLLALLETVSTPIFVHCQFGCDRTGTVVACYRIQHDRWSSELAWQEAERYGISKFEYLMKRYVVEFGRRAKPDARQARSE